MAPRDDGLHQVDGSLNKHVHQNLSCKPSRAFIPDRVSFHKCICRSDVYADQAQVWRLFCIFTKLTKCALSLRLTRECQHTKAMCDAGCTCCYCHVHTETQVFKQSRFRSQSVALSDLLACTCSDSCFSISISRLKLLDI